MQQTIRTERTGRRRAVSQPPRAAQAATGPFSFPANMAFSGEMVIDGDVVIDHVQDGLVEARNVHLGRNADVSGVVVGHTVVVEGRVEGAIYADRIVLRPSATVEGELWFRELDLAPGVWFEGKSRRVEAPRALADRLPRQLHGLRA